VCGCVANTDYGEGIVADGGHMASFHTIWFCREAHLEALKHIWTSRLPLPFDTRASGPS